MRITILTYGSRGDIQPYIALGIGLRASGHEVRIATQRQYGDLIHAYGLQHCSIDSFDGHGGIGGYYRKTGLPRKQRLLRMIEEELASMGCRQQLEQIRRMGFKYLQEYLATCQKCREICGDTEMLIYTPRTFYMASTVARLDGVKTFPTSLFPIHAMSSPPAGYDKILRMVTEAAYGNDIIFKVWRERILLLEPFEEKDLLKNCENGDQPFLYGVSPLVLPKPPEWRANIEVTGFWLLDSARQNWTPHPSLIRFLSSGPAPVFVGFGTSLIHTNRRALSAEILQALKLCGLRAVLLDRNLYLDGISMPNDNFYVIQSAAYDWLFPQMSALVFHGGGGTAAYALQAGVPSVIVPTATDQFFWAYRMQELGAGQVIELEHLSAASLASAIKRACEERTLRQRASRLSRSIAAEDGVGRAVELFNRYIGHR